MLNALFRFSRNRDIQAFPYCRTTHFVKGTDHFFKGCSHLSVYAYPCYTTHVIHAAMYRARALQEEKFLNT